MKTVTTTFSVLLFCAMLATNVLADKSLAETESVRLTDVFCDQGFGWIEGAWEATVPDEFNEKLRLEFIWNDPNIEVNAKLYSWFGVTYNSEASIYCEKDSKNLIYTHTGNDKDKANGVCRFEDRKLIIEFIHKDRMGNGNEMVVIFQQGDNTNLVMDMFLIIRNENPEQPEQMKLPIISKLDLKRCEPAS